MRRFAAIAGPLVAIALLVGTAPAVAAPMSDRESVSGSALKAYRAMAKPYKHTAPTGYGAITDNQGISCIADPAGTGAMGIHYLNGDELFDGEIDADQPEAYVYAPGPHGKLVALEYLVIKEVWDDSHSGPPELFAGHPFMETGAPNRFDLPPYYSQHVWIGRGNPNGNLAMWNPAVHCPS
jgi:hypothetical protein